MRTPVLRGPRAWRMLAAVFALAGTAACRSASPALQSGALLISATRLFDGEILRSNVAVLVRDGQIVGVGSPAVLSSSDQQVIELGDATILPGFIEPHAHALSAAVPLDVVLHHGVTTLRDLGGPLRLAAGGNGSVRLLTAGPILTAAGGYPIPAFSSELARVVTSPDDGRRAVRELVEGGASAIKVALEPGGEVGAPWMRHHAPPGGLAAAAATAHTGANTGANHALHPSTSAHATWPLLPSTIVAAIAEEAHRLGKPTVAHVGEERGVALALEAGIDQWAHVPCMPVPSALLKRAAGQRVTIVTTLDTLSRCPGVADNARRLVQFGAAMIYGAEIAHADVPWGIDGEELNQMRAAGLTPLEILRAATSHAGAAIGLAPLGTVAPGAPADLIAVQGDVLADFKRLEYPALVISGGVIVVNRFPAP